MQSTISIEALDPKDPRIDALAVEARAERYRFMDRLLSEARSGVNEFDKDGEVFYGAFLQGTLVACGGINIDPFSTKEAGRLRHLYVARSMRRKGIATQLVQRLLQTTETRFQTIRLRTPNTQADRFYDTLGFSRVTTKSATHILSR